MTKINVKGVILGGLLAGLIINISETIMNVPVLGSAMEAALVDRNLPPLGGGAIAGFIVGGFVLGVLVVWLYAAMRPRFGAGPKTALITAIGVWLLAYAWPGVIMSLMGFIPWKLQTIGMAWGLAEVIIAALAGGRIYSEV